jgi:hypothetical protein
MRAANREPRESGQGLRGLPCSVCGKPSVGWVYSTTTDVNGQDAIEAYSACDAHRLERVRPTDPVAIRIGAPMGLTAFVRRE